MLGDDLDDRFLIYFLLTLMFCLVDYSLFAN